jgi:hypothetical protein
MTSPRSGKHTQGRRQTRYGSYVLPLLFFKRLPDHIRHMDAGLVPLVKSQVKVKSQKRGERRQQCTRHHDNAFDSSATRRNNEPTRKSWELSLTGNCSDSIPCSKDNAGGC